MARAPKKNSTPAFCFARTRPPIEADRSYIITSPCRRLFRSGCDDGLWAGGGDGGGVDSGGGGAGAGGGFGPGFGAGGRIYAAGAHGWRAARGARPGRYFAGGVCPPFFGARADLLSRRDGGA